MFNTLMILLADATQGAPAAPAGAQPQGDGGLFGSPFILVVPMLLFAYLLFFRPMQKREQEKAALLKETKKNDKVITHAGIYGTVVAVSDTEDEITVRVDDNVRLKMVKNSILRNLTNEDAAKAAKDVKDAAKKGPKAPSSTAVTTKEGGA